MLASAVNAIVGIEDPFSPPPERLHELMTYHQLYQQPGCLDDAGLPGSLAMNSKRPRPCRSGRCPCRRWKATLTNQPGRQDRCTRKPRIASESRGVLTKRNLAQHSPQESGDRPPECPGRWSHSCLHHFRKHKPAWKPPVGSHSGVCFFLDCGAFPPLSFAICP